MSSLLTNESSMIALTTLRQINKDLSMVQQEISTGKSVSNARDNAAIWAVSTVMQSDVDSFGAISDSLNLGASTVGVARSTAEQITEKLTEIKDLIVASQEENVDREKIQADIDAKRDSIANFVNGAQFNGLNLLQGTEAANILASLDRAADGTVTASDIAVDRNDLSITGGTTLAITSTITASVALADGSTTPTTGNVVIGGTGVTAGEVFTVGNGTDTFYYVAREGDDEEAVAAGLAGVIGDAFGPDVTFNLNGDTLEFTNTGAAAVTITGAITAASTSGLAALSQINVTTDAGATSALNAIEGFIQIGIDAAADFGSSQKRIDDQNEFITNLTDALKVGIGALTDADMEEASARLQSLQVQQQLGVQALSIANQRPQILLGLFQ